MGRRSWTPLAEERLRCWYGVKPTRELAAELGVSERALWAKAGRMGLTAASYGTSGDWFPDEVETLRDLYPLLGSACAPLCGHSPRQVSSRAQHEGLRVAKPHRVPIDRERRKTALLVARWCVGHGMHAETVVEECAEWCGCTPAMMRMVLPRLLKDEMKHRKKKEDGNEQD